MSSKLPDGFLFGTATSATQIEGGCTTIDWWEFSHEEGRIAHGDVPDVACDHWNRWREDIELQTRLGMNGYRLSIEWGRVEPEDGRFDDAALDRYREEVKTLREVGIEPMVTLHHFSWPLWLHRRGGVLAPDMPDRFAAFTRRVANALGDHVKLWITINEPNVYLAQGFILGVWPPAKKGDVRALPKIVVALKRAHVRAYRALHELVPGASVGFAHHVRVASPATERLRDRAAAMLLDRTFNRLFFGVPQDFLGVNYYSRDVVRFSLRKATELFADRGIAEGAPTSDLGWEIYPEGLGIVLRDLARQKKPIFVTENGIADAKDEKRGRFLETHLAEVAKAIDEGIDVRGYMHWSLLDNFEWAEGYHPRFGLYEVDYPTQARKLRKSGERYAEIAKARRL